DGRREERTLPLAFRLLLPFTPNLHAFTAQPRLRRQCELTERQLVSAGFDGLLSGEEFLALRLLVPLVLGAFWVLIAAGFARLDATVRDHFTLIAILGVGLFYLQPLVWLRRSIKLRHRSIQRALPFVIDLLTLSVEAGIDFMSGLQRAVERRRMDPLTEELIRMIHEIQLGASRRVALRNLSQRVNMPDMRSFAYSLIQADELGVSIGVILRIQSDQMRQRRFDRAERLANEAPVKMLGPLMLFIFPAVFIVLLGPILSRVAGNLL
ncbi:MAG: type II secretion system F family protein, partial [Lentisphaerae bacterium]|nr:type II secretion system F family protein [Lentisphaerota bacterium]